MVTAAISSTVTLRYCSSAAMSISRVRVANAPSFRVLRSRRCVCRRNQTSIHSAAPMLSASGSEASSAPVLTPRG